MPTIEPFPYNLIAAIAHINPTLPTFALLAILADLVSGFVIKGVLAHNVQSSIMREGLIHKSWEVTIIICAVLVDLALAVGMGIGLQPLSDVTCCFIFVMELASVCENALAGNPELAGAPIIRYISQAAIEQGAADPDDTADLGEVPKHIGRGE